MKIVLLIFVLFNILSFIVPKRLSKIVIYATCTFGYIFGTTTDLILSLHYELYGYYKQGFQWVDLISVILYFPAISFLFLNFYPAEKRVFIKSIYILIWSAFAVSFEWFSIKVGFFYYNEWRSWYSAILYPFIFFILIMNMKFVQKMNQ